MNPALTVAGNSRHINSSTGSMRALAARRWQQEAILGNGIVFMVDFGDF